MLDKVLPGIIDRVGPGGFVPAQPKPEYASASK
jgi:uncharacterized protein YidB (DUF937 family)